jgi:hypothetical protein
MAAILSPFYQLFCLLGVLFGICPSVPGRLLEGVIMSVRVLSDLFEGNSDTVFCYL